MWMEAGTEDHGLGPELLHLQDPTVEDPVPVATEETAWGVGGGGD